MSEKDLKEMMVFYVKLEKRISELEKTNKETWQIIKTQNEVNLKNKKRISELEKRFNTQSDALHRNYEFISELEKKFKKWKRHTIQDYFKMEKVLKYIQNQTKEIAEFHNWIKSHIEKQNNDFAELREKLTTFQTKYPYTTAFDNSRQLNNLREDFYSHASLIIELRENTADLIEGVSNELKKQLNKLKEAFKKREEHQFHDYSILTNIKEVLRESIDFSNLLLELFLNSGIIDEDNHQRAYKEVKKMLEKLDGKVGSARQTEKKDNTCYYIPEGICWKDSGGEKTEEEGKKRAYKILKDEGLAGFLSKENIPKEKPPEPYEVYNCLDCEKTFPYDNISLNDDGDYLCPNCKSSNIQAPKEKLPEPIKICFSCKNAVYEDDLGLYEIKCEFDGEIYDENDGCDKYKYDPNHAKINPRIEPRENDIPSFWRASIKLGKTTELDYYKHIKPGELISEFLVKISDLYYQGSKLLFMETKQEYEERLK